MIKSLLYGLSLGGKTPGNEIVAAAKKPRVEVRSPLWIDQPHAPVKMHGGYNPARGRPWFQAIEADTATSLSCVTA
jgi:hypothetical protein